jgi:putative nucleotidyltransferase with HDIG domain
MKQLKELQSHTHFMLESLADTVDLRDPYTGGHSQRVAVHTAEILKSLGLQGPEAEIVILSARLHDIGKIGVPDYVLNKPGRFTPEEEAIMRTHPDRGADLLKRYPDFARGADIIRHHHENWDGTGYPHGIKRTDIPFGSRVIAVADSYDAMTSDRPYRVAMTQAKATSILKDGRGKQWDPEIVDAFLRTLDMQAAPFESLPSQPIYAQPSGATRPAHA